MAVPVRLAPGRGSMSQRRGLTTDLFFGPVAAVVYAIVCWYLVALYATGLPMPHQVLRALMDLVFSAGTYPDLGMTVQRVALGFLAGTLVGSAIGVLMGWRPGVNSYLRPLVMIGLAVPGPVTVITFTLILGITEISIVYALIFSVLPYVITLTMSAVKSLDLGLLDMSHVFRVPTWMRWRHVVLPQMIPAFFAAARVGFAVSWKFVVVIEAMVTSRGVGAQMLFSFNALRPDEMIAWALLFTVVMWTVETQVFVRIETYVNRWKSQGRDEPRQATAEAAAA